MRELLVKAGIFASGLGLIVLPCVAVLTAFGQAHAGDLMTLGIALVSAATGAHLGGGGGNGGGSSQGS